MVKLLSSSSRKGEGQARILEAVIAAAIIFVVFSGVTFFMRSSDITIVQERGELDRLGYNILDRIVESGAIEQELETKLDLWTIGQHFKAIILQALPSTVYFKLNIFNCTENGPWITLNPISLPNANNTSEDAFAISKEVSSTTVTYTSRTGSIYNIVLVLARGGEGD